MATATISRRAHDDEDVRQILKAILIEGQRFEQDGPGSRVALVEQARSLVTALESPLESIYGFMLVEPSRIFTGRMALDLKFFDTLRAELAAPSRASPKLVGRLIRHLAAMKMVDQTGEEEYSQNRISKYLESPKYREGICYCFDAVGPSLSKMPEYLLNIKYQNPEDTNDVMQAFQDYLCGVREDRPNFMDEDFYPVEDRLIKDLRSDEDDAAAFVDVGGDSGHALAEFKSKVLSWKGRLVLQKQESVVQIIKTKSHASLIEPTVHDFFTPQPFKGIRIYYMRYILHD